MPADPMLAAAREQAAAAGQQVTAAWVQAVGVIGGVIASILIARQADLRGRAAEERADTRARTAEVRAAQETAQARGEARQAYEQNQFERRRNLAAYCQSVVDELERVRTGITSDQAALAQNKHLPFMTITSASQAAAIVRESLGELAYLPEAPPLTAAKAQLDLWAQSIGTGPPADMLFHLEERILRLNALEQPFRDKLDPLTPVEPEK